MAKDPNQVAEKWRQNLSAAGTSIQQGVNRVSIAPTQQAAKKKEKLKTNWLAAIDNGSWERGLNAVSLEDWKAAMINKGLQRIQQGATAGQPKMLAYMQKLLPFQEQLSAKINAMPDTTLEDNIARMGEFIRGMAKGKKDGVF